jgi:hypothetical protein
MSHGDTFGHARNQRPWTQGPGQDQVHEPGRLLFSSRTSTVTDNAEQHPLLQRRLVVYSEVSSRGRVAVTLWEGNH